MKYLRNIVFALILSGCAYLLASSVDLAWEPPESILGDLEEEATGTITGIGQTCREIGETP